MFTFDFDEMEINCMKHQRQRFQEHQHRHDIMNFEYGVLALLQYKHPEQARQQEQQRHHKVQSGQRHFTGRQKVFSVFLFNVNLLVWRLTVRSARKCVYGVYTDGCLNRFCTSTMCIAHRSTAL